MSYICGRERLVGHGSPLRAAALDIAEHVLADCHPGRALLRRIKVDYDRLVADGQIYPLGGRKVFIVGAGKASFPIAAALEQRLADRITDGILICKDGQQGQLAHLRLRHAAHPVPDERSLSGAAECRAILSRAQSGDLILACFTGGSSALFVDPIPPISLADKQELNRLLLGCGAHIREINAVRKHVSRVKGGRLARTLPRGCDLINLTVSDVIGDPLDFITDPTVPDTSTLTDALAVLDKYHLWNTVPKSVAAHLRDTSDETVSAAGMAHIHRQDVLLLSASAPCDYAAKHAKRLGFEPMILSTQFDGDSYELANALVAIAREVAGAGRPLKAPCCLIAGGETTVSVSKNQFGLGGPNQEFAVAAALRLDGLADVVALAIDTDGTDGPTDAAGGLVDGETAEVARSTAVDLVLALREHNVTAALERVGDLVVTGATGTNVNDLKLLLVGPQASVSSIRVSAGS